MTSLLYILFQIAILLSAVIIATSRLTGICLFVAQDNLGTTLLFMPIYSQKFDFHVVLSILPMHQCIAHFCLANTRLYQLH